MAISWNETLAQLSAEERAAIERRSAEVKAEHATFLKLHRAGKPGRRTKPRSAPLGAVTLNENTSFRGV